MNPASVANGTVGLAYTQTLTGSGGATPYTFAVTASALPAWAPLNTNTGEITGLPNATTTASFTIQATDVNRCSGTRAYINTPVCPDITIAPAALPDGRVGTDLYSPVIILGPGTESIPLLKRAQEVKPSEGVGRFLEDLERYMKSRR